MNGSLEVVWREALGGVSAPTPLWLDRAPARSVAPGAPRRTARRNGPPAPAVEAFQSRHDLGLPAVAAGAWALLLAHYSREDDVVFGLAGAGEPVPERTTVRWDEDAVAWMRAQEGVRRRRRDAGRVTLAQLRKWSEVPEGIPLFESVVVTGAPASNSNPGSWPLVVGVEAAEPGACLKLWADADADRFDDWTLERLLVHLDRALRGLAADPSPRLGDITLVEDDERARLLVEWNRTAVDHGSDATISELFAEQVAARPEATAVVSESGALTYRELDSRSSQLARHLRRLGVAAETPVGLCVERTSDLVVALLGILKAGGAYLPLDASHPAERLAFMAQDASASVLLTQRSLAGSLAGIPGRTVVLEDVAASVAGEEPTPPENGTTSRSLAYIAYTSGSTGTPKGTEIRQRSVNRLVRAVDYVALGPDDGDAPRRSARFRRLHLRDLGRAAERWLLRHLPRFRAHRAGAGRGHSSPRGEHALAHVQPLQRLRGRRPGRVSGGCASC